MAKALKLGCSIHGHIYGFSTSEEIPLTNDPIYETKVVRYYRCIHCGHEAQDESLTLKDEFIQENDDGK